MTTGGGFLSRRRYLILLLSLVGFFVLVPIIGQTGGEGLVADLFFIWVVASGVLALRKMGKTWVAALVLGSSILLSPSFGLPALRSLELVRLGLQLGFLGFTSVVILTDVVSARRITLDQVLGAGCVYMLMGIFWGFLFVGIETLSPGSFNFSVSSGASGTSSTQMSLMYFSFATLTTLGYGDITPAVVSSRVFSVLEAVVGQLYLVILVARLVSLEILHATED